MTLGLATFALVLNMSAEFGGEKIAEVTYTDGSSSSIEAGRGLGIAGGLLTRFATDNRLKDLELQTTFGTKWTSTREAKNGGLSWSRLPLEALIFWRMPESRWRFGGGPTAHFQNKLEGSGFAGELDVPADTAYGFVLESDYALPDKPEVSVGARYCNIRYRASTNGVAVDGSSYGFGLTYTWGEQP